jgi:hypothetical protein
MESEGTSSQDAPQRQEGMRCHCTGSHRVVALEASIHVGQKYEQGICDRVSHEAKQYSQSQCCCTQKEGDHRLR